MSQRRDVLSLMLSFVDWLMPKIAFRFIFGVEPANLVTSPESYAELRVLEVKTVWRILTVKAQTLDYLYELETKLLNEKCWYRELSAFQEKVRAIQRTKERAKRSFWRAYALANRMRCGAGKSYKDYLPGGLCAV